jgi:hypothetical protein
LSTCGKSDDENRVGGPYSVLSTTDVEVLARKIGYKD